MDSPLLLPLPDDTFGLKYLIVYVSASCPVRYVLIASLHSLRPNTSKALSRMDLTTLVLRFSQLFCSSSSAVM